MATYAQLETLARDVTFQTRILWAARKAAEDITNNAAASVTQKKWADKVRRNAFDNRTVFSMTALALRNATLQAAVGGTDTAPTISSIDSDLQFVVNSLINVDADLAVLL